MMRRFFLKITLAVDHRMLKDCEGTHKECTHQENKNYHHIPSHQVSSEALLRFFEGKNKFEKLPSPCRCEYSNEF